jgi:hypothetical protein
MGEYHIVASHRKESPIMIKLAPFALALCIAATAFAEDSIDISGLESWGLDGDMQNQSAVFFPGPLDPELGYIIVRIDYDITIQTFGDSWFSDLTIRFGNSDGTFHGNWLDTFVPAAGTSFGGVQRFTGSFYTDIHLNDDAEFHVELFELVDDNPGALDAALLAGSTLTFGRFIPSPGSTSLLAIAGIAATRRRR